MKHHSQGLLKGVLLKLKLAEISAVEWLVLAAPTLKGHHSVSILIKSTPKMSLKVSGEKTLS